MVIRPIRPGARALVLFLATHCLPLVAQAPSLTLPVVSIALDNSTPPAAFVATGSGFFRSTDNGLNFRPIQLRAAGQVQPVINQVVIHTRAPNTIYAATGTSEGAVWRSTDGGLTWAAANTGLPAAGSAVESLSTIFGDPKSLYAKVGNQVYKTANSGDSWVLQGELPKGVSLLAVTPANPKRMYAVQGTAIQISDDEGVTWKQSRGQNLLPLASGTSVTSLVVDPADPTILYLAAAGAGGSGIYKSGDSGEAFAIVGGTSDFQPLGIFATPTIPPYLIATSLRPGVIYRSFNRGGTWSQTDTPPGVIFLTITYYPSDPDNAWAGSTAGPFISQLIEEDLRGPYVHWSSRAGFTRPTMGAPAVPFSFTIPPGQQGFVNFPIRVMETDRWSLNYNITTSGEPWLTVSNASGGTPSSSIFRVNASNLAAGDYSANIRINSPFTVNDPVSIPIKLTVKTPDAGIVYTSSTYAGTGGANNSGENAPARLSGVNAPDSIALDSKGNLYLSDPANNIVRRVSAGGMISRYAGNGEPAFNGDGGEARVAALNSPRGLAVDANDNLYIVDSGNNRIRRVSPDGFISTFTGDVPGARGIAIDPATGNVYVTFPLFHIVLRFNQSGQRFLFAGTASDTVAGVVVFAGFRGDGGNAVFARLNGPQDVAAGPDGTVYIADTENNRIRAVGADGKIRTVAGHGAAGFQGDSADALTSALNRPAGLATGLDGNVYFVEDENNRVRVISPDGRIRNLAGTGVAGFSGDGGNSLNAQVRAPADIAVDTDGNIFFADRGNNRIRLLTPPPRPRITPDGLVNLIDDTTRLAPGSLFRLRGSSMASSTVTAASGEPWPATLNNVTVSFNGKPAPLAMVSALAITGQAPPDAAPGPVRVHVVKAGRDSGEFPATLLPAAPSIILFANEDGETIASAARPSVVVVYFTGQGNAANAVAASLGDRGLEVVSVTPSATQQGVVLATVKIPEDLEAGDYDLTISVRDESSKKSLTVQ